MTNPRRRSMKSLAKTVASTAPVWVFLFTFFALAVHPVPECVACEYSHPWGRDNGSAARDSILILAWLGGASLLAGYFGVKWKWLVPASIVLADLATQPIGGVPLWSLASNEGPMILLLGVPLGAASLLVGLLVRRCVEQVRRSAHARST